MCNHLDRPKDFANRVRRALRAWHTGHAKDTLDDLLLMKQLQVEEAVTNPRLVTNKILLSALESLKQVNRQGAELLQWRFLNQETAKEVAHRWNVGQDVIFQWQRAAIDQLAEVVWEHELEHRQQQAWRIEARLEPRTYSRLFGVTEKMAEVCRQLEVTSAPWLIALEGLGGIGKTSLADAVVRELACHSQFHEIGWVSARRRLFQLSGDFETVANPSDLTLTELVDRLVDQFELVASKRQSDAEKLAGLKDFLKSQPCLIVVDNLETVDDYHSLVLQLTGFAGPSKFLITTRRALRDVSGVYGVPLTELSRDDTLALIRYEAETRGQRELASATDAELEQIYDITGGNPLATKLIIGQTSTLPLSKALDLFKMAKGKPIDSLFSYIYASAWESLDSPSRRVLQTIRLSATEEGGQLEQIAAAAELNEADVAACLQRLAALSLVDVGGNLEVKRYALHQLTQTFLAQQSLDDN
jgi:hypothetical protein